VKGQLKRDLVNNANAIQRADLLAFNGFLAEDRRRLV
jgi:hypothetical protein